MPFDLQPTLAGKLIELRPLKPADFDALFAAASDPLIWEQHPENTRYKKDVFQTYFDSAPWLVFFPSVCIALLALSFNLVGDALRDILDPTLRGRH